MSGDGEVVVPLRDRVRCPSCRSSDVVLTEISTVGMPFHQCEDGALRRIESNREPEIFRVEARCSTCSHSWTPRGLSTGIGSLAGWATSDRRTCGCEHT